MPIDCVCQKVVKVTWSLAEVQASCQVAGTGNVPVPPDCSITAAPLVDHQLGYWLAFAQALLGTVMGVVRGPRSDAVAAVQAVGAGMSCVGGIRSSGMVGED